MPSTRTVPLSCGGALLIAVMVFLVRTHDAPERAAVSPSAVRPASGSDGYRQSPSLDAAVAARALPPVAQRLPEDPYVEPVVDRIGRYGGNFRGFMLGDADKWVLYKTALSGGLITRSYREMTTISKNGMHGWSPAIAERWTWDANATGLTVKLRAGVKWSDGVPLVADDIVWTWNAIQRNPAFQPAVPAQFVINGKPIAVDKVDALTVHFTFAGPAPWFLSTLYAGSLAAYSPLLAPKHYLERFVPTARNGRTWQDLQTAYSPANPALPTASPWMLRKYDPATEAVLVRNPYYWAVDPAGNQLPYIDTMTFTAVGSQETAVLRVMAGQVDFAARNVQVLQNLAILSRFKKQGNYRIDLAQGDNFTNANEIWFDYDMKDRADPLRAYLREPAFRVALSRAIDREAVNQNLFLGLAKPSSIGLSSKSPYWSGAMAQIASTNAQFDQPSARRMLDTMGLKDRDGDGFRDYPGGRGKVSITLGAASEITAHVNFAEMVVSYWRQIGIDARLGIQTRQALFAGITGREFNAVVWGATGVAFPEFRTSEGLLTAAYQTNPTQVPDAPADVRQLWALRDQIIRSTDPQATQRLMEAAQRLRATNAISIFTARDVPFIMIKSNRLMNVPAGDVVLIDEMDHLVLKPEQWFVTGASGGERR